MANVATVKLLPCCASLVAKAVAIHTVLPNFYLWPHKYDICGANVEIGEQENSDNNISADVMGEV